MAKRSLNGVLQHLRTLAAVQTCRDVSDRDLLGRFIGTRDEGAFTVLIERHGPMVLGVCRRALPCFHDAEDACQATFLVLARRAASIRKKTSLSSWLHGVACRVAADLKRGHARRKTRERGVNAPQSKDPAAEVTWREVQTILDEELQKLPDRNRAPVILCYLECVTRDEAAQRLGLSPTTLHGRLEYARELLRKRLTRRGLTIATVMSAAVLSESGAQASLTPTFVISSTKAAVLIAARQPVTERVVASHVLTLTQEVLKTMLLTKMKLGTAAMICATLFAALIGSAFTSLGVAQQFTPSEESAFQASPKKQDAVQAGGQQEQVSASTQPNLKMEKKSGTLTLDSMDLAKGTIRGSRVDTNPERTFFSYRQESWELRVTPATKITIDGMDAKLADLELVQPLAGSDRMNLIFVGAELEVSDVAKSGKRKGSAVRIVATGVQVRGMIKAINVGKNTVAVKRIGRGFSEEVIDENAVEFKLVKDVPVTINHRKATAGDLKPNTKVLLQMSAVKELVLGMTAYGATVDGILKAVDTARNVVSVTIPSAQMTAEGVSVAKNAKVVIDGKESTFSDLKAGMRVTLQMSAEPDESVIIGITKETAR